MAKYNLENYLDKDGLGFPLNFRRGNPNPLDNSSVWKSLAEAQNYAQTDPTAYVGQVLSVVNYTPAVTEEVDGEVVIKTPSQSTVEVYYIKDEAGNLEPVGTSPIGDEKTVTVAEDGTVSLYGVAGLEFERDVVDEEGNPTGQKENVQFQPLMTKDGLVWVEPSKTTVEGLAALIDGLTIRVSALENDRVTEQELADAIKELKEYADAAYDDTKLAGRVKTIEDDYLKAADKIELQGNIDVVGGKVTTLIGSDAGKSVRTIANEELAAQLIPEDAAEAYDTLQEIAAWIQEHPGDAAEMNREIDDLQEKVVLGTYVDGEETKEYATVKAYVEAEVKVVSDALTAYQDAHASDYTNTQIDAAIKVNTDAIDTLDNKVDIGDKTVSEYVDDAIDTISGDNKSISISEDKVISILGFNGLGTEQVQYLPRTKKVVDKEAVSTSEETTVNETYSGDVSQKTIISIPITSPDVLKSATVTSVYLNNTNGSVGLQSSLYTVSGPLNKTIVVSLTDTSYVDEYDTIDINYTYVYERTTITEAEEAHLELEWAPMDSIAVDGDGNTRTVVKAGDNGLVSVNGTYDGGTDTYTYTVDVLKDEQGNPVFLQKEEEYSELNTTAKTVLDAINELDGKTFDKIEEIDFNADDVTAHGLEFIEINDGIITHNVVFRDSTEKFQGIAHFNLPIAAGENVTIAANEDKTNVVIGVPQATLAALGVVKSSEAQNKVYVEEDGTMTVNSLNVNKLEQTEGEWLILNGGNASLA